MKKFKLNKEHWKIDYGSRADYERIKYSRLYNIVNEDGMYSIHGYQMLKSLNY